MTRSGPVNALTFDVEDYFQVSAMEPYVSRSRWETMPCRVEANVDRLLQLLDDADARATFFTLGWVGERYPALVRRIVAGGHELASHGYWHERVSSLTMDAFRADVTRAREVLEDAGGVPVRGYRAPSFSIGAGNLEALRVLQETGHTYSSSVYPVRHDHYGMPDASRTPFRPLADGVIELPLTTVRLVGRNNPAAGGGYFRLLPYAVSRWALGRVNHKDGWPAVFYLHPWEIDPDQPRIPGVSWKTRFRHYVNLARTEPRLRRLLNDFDWDRVDVAFADSLASAVPPRPAAAAVTSGSGAATGAGVQG